MLSRVDDCYDLDGLERSILAKVKEIVGLAFDHGIQWFIRVVVVGGEAGGYGVWMQRGPGLDESLINEGAFGGRIVVSQDSPKNVNNDAVCLSSRVLRSGGYWELNMATLKKLSSSMPYRDKQGCRLDAFWYDASGAVLVSFMGVISLAPGGIFLILIAFGCFARFLRKFYQRTGRKIIIDGSNTAGYDKSKVECFNCHKMRHFSRECRAPRSKDNRNWNQCSSTKTVKIEDASKKAMCAIDGASFDWSNMAEEEIQANMALMAFSDSEEIALLKKK
ncbi:ribonuclease H-like domain-containing protein [Tanacetum coccineum]